MTLKTRIRRAEEIVLKAEEQPVFLWDDGSKSREELLAGVPEADRERAIIFGWRLEPSESDYPILRGEVIPGIDMEIERAVLDARNAGVPEAEIRSALNGVPFFLPQPEQPDPGREEAGDPSDFVRLMGKGKRGFSIEQG